MEKDYDESFRDHFASGGSYSDFNCDPMPMLRIISSDLRVAEDPLIRQGLKLEYIDMAMRSTFPYDTNTVRLFVNEVPESSLAMSRSVNRQTSANM